MPPLSPRPTAPSPRPAAALPPGPGRRTAAAAALALLLLLTAVVATLTERWGGAPSATASPTPAGTTPPAASPPTASPPATATPVTPSATPAPAAEALLARDLSGRCIPEPGRPACDPLRAALWAGDPAAWREWTAARGEPPLTPAQVQTATITLRLSAGDPAARIDLARATGQPLPLITGVRLRLLNGRTLVTGLEIANLGAVAAELSGVEVAGGAARLATGATLPPGERCAVGAGAAGPCPLAGAFVPVLLGPGEAVRLRAPDGRLLDEFVLP